jgi:hypothetical protein
MQMDLIVIPCLSAFVMTPVDLGHRSASASENLADATIFTPK